MEAEGEDGWEREERGVASREVGEEGKAGRKREATTTAECP